jgi:hypothetical protein
VREPTPPPAADKQLVVVATEEAEQPFRGGLLTTKQQRTQVLSSRDARKEQDEDKDKDDSALRERVYRDASGRKIDMKVEKAEVARKKCEHEEREAQKGDVTLLVRSTIHTLNAYTRINTVSGRSLNFDVFCHARSRCLFITLEHRHSTPEA